ncbi:prestin-like [Amia ocellicauda]|uniref:prestin-like n=1 Tax=Amia ocellicauda TaxID=2972642 RepID=UPI003463C15E
MANALMAAVPPVFGLYSSFYPVLVYFIFGTSRHISVGTSAILAIMVGMVAVDLVPDVASLGNRTEGAESGQWSLEAARVGVAAQVTFMSGLIQLVLGVLRLGAVSCWLSEPLVRGYTTAAAYYVTVYQLRFLMGIKTGGHSGVLAALRTLVDVLSRITEASLGTLVVSAVSVGMLLGLRLLNRLLVKRLPAPIPSELITIVVMTGVSAHMGLSARYGVEVVGDIPSGLSAPALPPLSFSVGVLLPAFAIAVVGFGFMASFAKMAALKHGYSVDNNQELVALGLSNSVGGVFQCFAVSCSMSRTLVQESTGGKTQMASALSALVILVILLKVGELFQQLPKTVLAAIIVVSLQGMYRQVTDMVALWRTDRMDLLVWVVTFVATLVLNLDLGLAAAIGFALLTVIFRTQSPRYSLLGQIPGTDCYRDIRCYSEARQIPGITIFHCSAPLYFANAELYHSTLREQVRLWVSDTGSSGPLQGAAPRPHCLILDLSPASNADTATVNTLRRVVQDFSERGVCVCLAACQPLLVNQLQSQGFLQEVLPKSRLFPSVHHAVQHCLSSCPAPDSANHDPAEAAHPESSLVASDL